MISSTSEMGYLYRVYRATEELNKQVILKNLNGVHAENLLDCGCGDGAFTLRLANAVTAKVVAGVEVDGPRAEVARSNGIIVVNEDLNSGLPYDDNTFDVVHANQVIEHVVDTDRLLKEMRRVVRPRGRVVVSTNNMAAWHNVLSLVLGFQPPPQHVSGEIIVGNPLDPRNGESHPTPGDSHLRLFSFRGFKDICEYHGFEILRLLTVGYYPLPPRLARVMTSIDRRHGAFLVAVLTKS
jgi:methionine biosynthesis protein MetW